MNERRRRRSATRILAVALCLVLGLSGCIGRTSSTVGPDGSITIRFLHAHGDDTFLPAIEEFERQNPKIHVEQQPVPFDDLNAQVQARVGSEDTSIDVYAADPPRIPAQAERGFLLDLSSDRAGIERAVSRASLNSVTWKGKIWGYPIWTSSSFLLYNKGLLRKAGIPEPGHGPADRLTWEQVVADGKKAQRAGARYGLGFDQVDRYYQLQPLFESAGAGPGLRGKGNLTPDVDSAKWRKVARWYAGLHEDGLAPRGIPPEQMPSAFMSGQVAFFLGGPGKLDEFLTTDGLDFGIAPHPSFAGGTPASPTDSWSVGVSAYSEHPGAAKKFARFLSLDTKGAALAVSEVTLPPVNKVAYRRYVADYVRKGGQSLAGFDELLNGEITDTAVHRPRSVGYVDFETQLNKTFSDIRNGGDVDELLDKANDRLDDLMKRYRELPS